MKDTIVNLKKHRAYLIGKYVKYGDSSICKTYRSQCSKHNMPCAYVTLRSKQFVDIHIDYAQQGFLFGTVYADAYRAALDIVLSCVAYPTYKPYMECSASVQEDYMSIDNIPYPLLDASLTHLLDLIIPGVSKNHPGEYKRENEATAKRIKEEYEPKFKALQRPPSRVSYEKEVMQKWESIPNRIRYFNIFGGGDISYILNRVGQSAYYATLDLIAERVNAQKKRHLLESRQDAENWLQGIEP